MTNQKNRPTVPADLRQKAEALARERADRISQDSAALSPEEIRKTLHELRVHQIELELQNEELRQAQDKIEAGRARYFDLYDLAPVGYCTLSEQGLILEANLTVAVLLDTARGALVKQPISRFILKEDQDICYLHRKKLFETHSTGSGQAGEPQECELRLLKPDGRLFWGHLTGTVAQAVDGALVCRVVIINITERKRVEEEREKLQAQLFQSQKMESVGMLAGGIAHDFNNLLHAMGGNLELLLKNKPEDHPDVKRLKTIEKSVIRSAKLILQLLTFSRKAEPSKQPLDLDHEIVSAAQVLERTIPKMVKIELYPGKDIRSVNADPVQIEQILLNLGVNATDAMPEGGRLIIETKNTIMDQDFVRTHQGARPGEYVLMTVTDTGCGMDKKNLEHVFDPFFTTKEVGRGTGLGLASVYGIIKAHEGYITCYSEPGQGTAFKIYWPVAEPGEIEPDEIQTEQAVLQDGTETILIVDDDDEIRDLARELLEDKGYQVLSAASGEQALEIFKEHAREIDLVVMDLNMPGMGGRKCTREMLSIDPSVKVLVASGYSANGHGREILEFGARDFISKPYQMREILAKIREVLDGE